MPESDPGSTAPQIGDSLVTAALKVLLQPDPCVKAQYTNTAIELWRNGGISSVSDGRQESQRVPDRPSRADDKVKLVAPGAMPRLGKGGTLQSRQALLHSLVHIESWAIDLSWDIIARFGGDSRYKLPKEFFDDFVQVAADECSHFISLCKRLEAIGSYYGALPAHDGLWESASSTRHSLPARLAVEHCVHEARGLDVLPNTIHKLRSNGDAQTAALLEDVIYAEEISHCAAGVRWLKYLHQQAKQQQQQQQQKQQKQQQQQQAECSPCNGFIKPSAAGAGLQLHGQAPGSDGAEVASAAAAPAAAPIETASTTAAAPIEAAPIEAASTTAAPTVAASTTTAAVTTAAASTAVATVTDTIANHNWVSDAQQYDSVEQWFHALIRTHFKGNLKPPFNDAARAKAGFGPEWYMPLVAQQ